MRPCHHALGAPGRERRAASGTACACSVSDRRIAFPSATNTRCGLRRESTAEDFAGTVLGCAAMSPGLDVEFARSPAILLFMNRGGPGGVDPHPPARGKHRRRARARRSSAGDRRGLADAMPAVLAAGRQAGTVVPELPLRSRRRHGWHILISGCTARHSPARNDGRPRAGCSSGLRDRHRREWFTAIGRASEARRIQRPS